MRDRICQGPSRYLLKCKCTSVLPGRKDITSKNVTTPHWTVVINPNMTGCC